MSTLGFVVSGTSYNKGDVRKDGIRILRGGNIQEEMLFLQDFDVYVPHSYKDEEKNVRKGDIILVASTGSLTAIGKAAYIYNNYTDVQIGAFMRIVRPYSMEYAEYMGKFFTTDNYRSHIRSLVSGTNINNIKAEHLLTLMVPIPPIEEQHRILKSLEELSPEISEYSELHQKQEKQEEYFPTLLKKSILHHAIQGKLVPQDPNDEPASVLLERIAKERTKLGKKAAKSMSRIERRDRGTYEIFPDGSEKDISEEIPFDIPESWEWCRLSTVLLIARGGSPRPIKDYLTNDENGVNWIKIGDTTKGSKYIFTTREKIKPEGIAKSRLVYPGDFLLSNSMSFGRPYILRTSGCIHDGWLVLSDIELCFNVDYLFYLLSSPLAKSQFAESAAGAVVQNLNIAKVENAIFPIPPKEEQVRIQAVISTLFSDMPI